MQENPVRPKCSEKRPHAEEVEAVDGMDVTVRADAGDSEEAYRISTMYDVQHITKPE